MVIQQNKGNDIIILFMILLGYAQLSRLLSNQGTHKHKPKHRLQNIDILPDIIHWFITPLYFLLRIMKEHRFGYNINSRVKKEKSKTHTIMTKLEVQRTVITKEERNYRKSECLLSCISNKLSSDLVMSVS